MIYRFDFDRVGWFKPNGLNHWFKQWFKPLKKDMFYFYFLVLMNLNILFSTIKATYVKRWFFKPFGGEMCNNSPPAPGLYKFGKIMRIYIIIHLLSLYFLRNHLFMNDMK